MSAARLLSPTAENAGAEVSPAARIDVSCRWPLLLLFTSALLWLVLATLLSLIVAIKFHGAGFLADSAWLTLGRLRPAATNALLYGFLSQAGLGVALWLLCRLGRVTLTFHWPLLVAWKLWNLGVTVGVIAILAGASTGFEWLEMPRYAAGILFVANLLIGLCAVATFAQRREQDLYPSQWFLLAGLFWFPWTYSAANYLLLLEPVRGTFQSAVDAWFTGNLLGMWFTPLALAAIYYFVPRLTGRPLFSRDYAIFGFWTLLAFGGLAGLASLEGSPVPRWMGSVGTAATVCLLVPAIANVLNWSQTFTTPGPAVARDPILNFIAFGAAAYAVHALVSALSVVPAIQAVTSLTYAGVARTTLALQGFVGMVLCGSIYYILPRVAGVAWPRPAWIRVHFLSSACGVVLIFVSLTLGGVLQGMRLADSAVPFLSVVKGTIPFIGLSTLGVLLLLVGQVAFLGNLALLLRGFAQPMVLAFCAECCGPLRPAKAGGES